MDKRIKTEVTTEGRRGDRVHTEVSAEGRRGDRVHTEVSAEGRRGDRVHTEVSAEGRRGDRVHTEVSAEGRRGERVHTEVSTGRRDTEALEKQFHLLPEDTNMYGDIPEIANTDTLSKVLKRVNSAPIREDFDSNVQKMHSLLSVCEKEYQILEKLNEGGESIVLLCSYQGSKVVAKVFKGAENAGAHSLETREQVFEFMNSSEGRECVVPVIDFGLVSVIQGYLNYFEIFPYYPDGDMENTKIENFDELKDIIRELNQSIHKIHQKGILHLDIKPANIYRQAGKLLLGDFGIAKSMKNTATKTTVGTDGFRAPETVFSVYGGEKAQYIYTEACDYYSFGVTIASLYEGRNYFDGLEQNLTTVRIQKGNLLLSCSSADISFAQCKQLQTLVNCLCQFAPDYRFNYEDVCKWLENPDYKGNVEKSEEADGAVWLREFSIEVNGREYCLKTPEELFEALTDSGDAWKEGMRNLYENYFEEFFKGFDQKLARKANELSKKYVKRNRNLGFFYFLKELYPPGPIAWCGGKWRSLEALSKDIFHSAGLKKRNLQGYASLLNNKIVSYWLQNTEGCTATDEIVKKVKMLEGLSSKFPEIACYWLGYIFASDLNDPLYSCLKIGNKQVNGLSELFRTAFSGPEKFYADQGIYDTLVKWNTDEGAKIYARLCLMGLYPQIEETFINRNDDEFAHFTEVFMFWGALGEMLGMDMTDFNHFFLYYGPLAAIRYICEIQQKEHIYVSIDQSKNELLTTIENTVLPEDCNYKKSYKNLEHMFFILDELRQNLYNNPYLLQVGMIEENQKSKGIICNNLKGYFGYVFFGETVPLGLAQFIQEDL